MSPSRGYQRFFAELKRRHVFKVAAVYGVVGFGVLEAADVLVPALHLPDAVTTAVAVLLLLGFPIALVIAWAFEMTSEGLERTPDVGDRVLDQIASESKRSRWPIGVAALIASVLLVGSAWFVLRSVGETRVAADAGEATSSSASGLDPLKIAVLPFTNMSGDEENERFALGVHNDIHNRLTRLRNLKVISRPSVMVYKDSSAALEEIAVDLGAGSVLTGAAQRSGTRLRISVELVDARTDETLWTQQYDREWSVDDLLDTQTEIAEAVATSLDATLSEAEREALAVAPTRSPEAYDLYLQAVEFYELGFETPDILLSIRRAEEAVEADPEFSLAWMQLSVSNLYLYWDGYDRTPERLQAATEALEQARRLTPDLPEVQSATGRLYYHGHLMYDSALAILEPLVETAPSTNWVLEGIGAIKRRQGKLDESIEYFKRAYELDPRVATYGTELGLSYALIRDYDTALPLVENYVVENPQGGFGYASMIRLNLAKDGNLGRARFWINEGDEAGARRPYLDYQAFRTYMFAREYDPAITRLANAPGQALGEFQFMYYPVSLLEGLAYHAAGDEPAAVEAFSRAAAHLEAMSDSLPDDERFRGSLGLAYAGLGRNDEAVGEALRGVELMPMEREHWRGSHRVEELARVYALVGEPELAVERIEYLLSVPGELSVAQLRLDPAWDGLRDHPRFQALIAD